MKKDQLIIVGLIILCGLGLVIFGRTQSGPAPTSMAQVREALIARQVPVHVIVQARTKEGKAFIKDVRKAVAGTERNRVRVIITDTDNPNEKAALQEMHIPEGPAVLVLGLDGQNQYSEKGGFEAEKLRQAVTEGLKRTPIPLENLGVGETGHQH